MDQAIRPQPSQDRSEPRSRSAMRSNHPGVQGRGTVAQSKNFAGRQNCVRVGSTGNSMAHAPEASRHAGDSRPQGPSAPASPRSLARAANLPPAPTAETWLAVLSYASPSSNIICASRRAKIRTQYVVAQFENIYHSEARPCRARNLLFRWWREADSSPIKLASE